MSDDFLPPPSKVPKTIISPEPSPSSGPPAPPPPPKPPTTPPTPPTAPPPPKPPTSPAPLQAPVTPPAPPLPPNPDLLPSAPLPAPPPKTSRKGLILGALLLVIAGVAGAAAYAYYYRDWNPFAKPLTSQEVLARMFARLPEMATARQQTTFSFASEPRETGAISFAESLPNLHQQTEQVARDQQRLQNLMVMQSTLQRLQEVNSIYPANLDAVAEQLFLAPTNPTRDPLTNQPYGYRQENAGTDFILHIPLETEAARQALVDGYASQQAGLPVFRDTNTLEVSAVSPRVLPEITSSHPSFMRFLLSDSTYQSLPAEVKVLIESASNTEVRKSLESDGETTLSGQVELKDLSVRAGLDIRKKGRVYFARLNEAPPLGFFDPTSLKGQWVRLSLDDIPNPDFQNTLNKTTARLEQQSTQLSEQYQIIAAYLQSSGMLEVTEELPMKEDGSGRYYHYRLRLIAQKIAPFYQQVAQNLEQRFGDDAVISYDENVFAALTTPDFLTMSELAANDTSLELQVEANDFWPHSLTVNTRLVPPPSIEKLASKQYRIIYSTRLAEINQPVAVDEPASSITWQQALQLATGIPAENVVDALDPATIDDLIPVLHTASPSPAVAN